MKQILHTLATYLNFVILLLLLNFTSSYAEFAKKIGEVNITEYPVGIFQLEKNLLISVTAITNFSNINEISVDKLDTLGNITSTNKIMMFNNFYLSGIEILKDSTGFLLSGNYFTNYIGKNIQTGFIIKIDNDGNQLWMNDFLFSVGPTLFYKVNELEDGNIVVSGGIINAEKNNLFDYLIIKTNSFGELIWYKSYGTYGNEVAKRAVQTKDGGYILSGDSNGSLEDESFSSNTNVYVMGLDSVGEFKWHYFIGNGDLAYGCQEHILTKDDNVVICGEGTVEEFGSFDYLLVRIDKDGKILNQKTIGTSEFSEAAFSICEFKNGNFGFVGYENSINIDFVQRFIYYLLDSEFNVILKHAFTQTGRGQGNFIGLGMNESVLMAGVFQDEDIFDDGFICYLNPENKLVTSINSNQSNDNNNFDNNFKVNLFPNPCTEFINIKTNKSFDLMRIYNSIGELQTTIFIEEPNANNDFKLNTLGFNSGLYFINFYKNNQFIDSQIFIKSK